jgi:hypothetical protein
MDQRRLADILAPIVCPAEYSFSPLGADYIRAVYGEEAADNFIMDLDYQLFLSRSGRRGEFILSQTGCDPPYEESVPKIFQWLTAERIEGIKTDAIRVGFASED